MNNSFPNFPMEEFKAELERENAEFKSALQKSLDKSLAELYVQNPQLKDVEITELSSMEFSLKLQMVSPKGIILKYLVQLQDSVYQQLSSQTEREVGRPSTPGEVDFLITIPSSEITIRDQIKDNVELLRRMQNIFLTTIDEITLKVQTTRPDIQINVYLPDPSGAQILAYVESNGRVLMDEIIKPPTVTFDTSVIIEYWKNQAKIEHVEKLLELGNKLEIDLAVSGRIHDDIPRQPLANKINDLPDLNIHEIGAVIRVGNWKIGIDIAGSDDFNNLIDSLESSVKFRDMNKDKRPDWRDWDHIHTHYRYGRDYFLTWDRRILHFKEELHDELGITVMKPEKYLLEHQPTHSERLMEKTYDS